MIRPHLLLAVLLCMLASCQQDPTRSAIEGQLQQYPASRVQDIYKSFCQDNLGPEHLIPNPDAARNYLHRELQEYRDELMNTKRLTRKIKTL